MKNYRLLLLSAILVIITSTLNSQVYDDAIFDHLEYLRRDNLMSDFDAGAYANIDGSPFMIPDFTHGAVYLKSGEVYSGEFRYDIYADQIQFKVKDHIYILAFPEKITKITIADMYFKYYSYSIDGQIRHGYFSGLEEGYIALCLKMGKELKDPQHAKPYQDPKPAKFLNKKDQFYIFIGDTPGKRVVNKRTVVNLFHEANIDVDQFLKGNRINLNNSDDLIKLIVFANDELKD